VEAGAGVRGRSCPVGVKPDSKDLLPQLDPTPQPAFECGLCSLTKSAPRLGASWRRFEVAGQGGEEDAQITIAALAPRKRHERLPPTKSTSAQRPRKHPHDREETEAEGRTPKKGRRD